GPLAVHHFVKIIGIGDVGGFHAAGGFAVRRLGRRVTDCCTTHALTLSPLTCPIWTNVLRMIQLCWSWCVLFVFSMSGGIAGCFLRSWSVILARRTGRQKGSFARWLVHPKNI